MIFQGGIGGVIANPTGGNLATPSFPQRFFTIQSAELDLSQKLVKAMGQNKGPDDVFPSDTDYKGKCGFLQISPDIFNALLFGDTIATGYEPVVAAPEQHTVPAVSTYTITITPPSSGTFAKDLGVQYLTNPSGFSAAANLEAQTAALTAAGQYQVNNSTGIYTFYSGDASAIVLISYAYTLATGRVLTNYNHIQGYGPYFEMWMPMSYQGNNILHVRRARVATMGFKMKRDGYLESPFDFECFPDASGAFFDFGVANAG